MRITRQSGATACFKQDHGGLPVDAVDQLLQGMEQQRHEMFIDCWCASEHESAAMWSLYRQSAEGVAIRTDHDSLERIPAIVAYLPERSFFSRKVSIAAKHMSK